MTRTLLHIGLLLAVFFAVCAALLALGTGKEVALLAGQGAFALALVIVIARG